MIIVTIIGNDITHTKNKTILLHFIARYFITLLFTSIMYTVRKSKKK